MVRSPDYAIAENKQDTIKSKQLNEKVTKKDRAETKKIFSNAFPRTFKVVVIGDMSVGKTCLVCRLCGGKFPEYTETTIGVDFLECKLEVEGEPIKLQLWDTAGQERFRHSMVPHYYRNVDAVVYVFDVTNRSSFENIPRWLQEFQTQALNNRRVPQVIIGNKCDLHADRQVRTSEVKSVANHYGLPYWETSAKSDLEKDTIEVIFKSLAESLKLKTPIVDFPPEYSSEIIRRNQSGLRMSQSIAATNNSGSQSMSGSDKNRSQTPTKKKSCCNG